MDQLSGREREERVREVIALAEETVKLVKNLIEGLEEQIAEWKRLAESQSPEG